MNKREMAELLAEVQESLDRAKPKDLASASEMARKWGLTTRRVRVLCQEHKVFRATRDADGNWRIPRNADRPVDSRAYRYRKVPSHFQNGIRHVDTVVREERARPPEFTQEDRWRYFLVGSSYHLHRLNRGLLNLGDIRRIVNGATIAEKGMRQQEEVRRHCLALERVADAVRSRRRLSVRLVRELWRTLAGGERVDFADGGESELAVLVHLTLHSRAHPVIRAGNFMTEMYIRRPFSDYNERVGYMVANFILLRCGYPPVIIHRIVFSQVEKLQRQFAEMAEIDRRRECARHVHHPPRLPPPVRSAFLNACIMRAVIVACRHHHLAHLRF